MATSQQVMDILDATASAWKAGVSVVPVKSDGSKRPDLASWTDYQALQCNRDELQRWFGRRESPAGRVAVGWVTGKVSGNLECIDFDTVEALSDFRERAADFGAGELVELVLAGYSERTPHGAHMFWRCDEISGNQKLATQADGKVVIETRGEGGYVIVAPSGGGTHPTGKSYERTAGSPSEIVTITPDQRDELLTVARSLDQRIHPQAEPPRSAVEHDGDRPGDIYAARTSWSDVLEPFGWTLTKRRGSEGYWRRPNAKTSRIDATTNYSDSDMLYVFSTSAYPFEIERGYSKFSVYALLKHDGDYSAAARDLAAQGYASTVEDFGSNIRLGASSPTQVVVAASTDDGASANRSDDYHFDHGWPSDGFVGRYISWASNQTDAPHEYHEAAALSLLASCSPNVRTFFPPWPTGLATNLYLLIVGGTTASRKSTSLGYATGLMQDVESSTVMPNRSTPEALIEALAVRSRRGSLIIGDEFGSSLEQMLSRNSYMSAAPGIILEAYGTRRYRYQRRSKRNPADGKSRADFDEMVDPHLTLLTASTASIFESLSSREVQSGLLPRFAFIWPTTRPERRPFYEPAPNGENERAWLLSYLQHLFLWSSTSIDKQDIPATWTEQAALIADSAIERIEAQPSEIIQRLSAMTLKLAMLSSLSVEVPAVHELSVDESDARQASRVVERWTDAALRFSAQVGGLTAVQRQAEHGHDRILAQLASGAMKRSQLSRDLKLTARQTDEIENTLLDRGLITVSQQQPDGPGRPAKVWELA